MYFIYKYSYLPLLSNKQSSIVIRGEIFGTCIILNPRTETAMEVAILYDVMRRI